MKIAFHLYFMGLRGTEVATWNYAHYCEELLGYESVILYRETPNSHYTPAGRALFADRFPVIDFKTDKELTAIIAAEGIDAVYNHEVYADATWVAEGARTLIHGVFQWCRPRGDVFAAISPWLGLKLGHPYVPLMIDLPQPEGDLREELGIPPEAVVIGRHGGAGTFNLPFVHETVQRMVNERDQLWFLFLNTEPFMQEHPRVIHLPGTTDKPYKSRFIETCDAMLHARSHGESFGLAIGEFSVRNKPVITWRGGTDRAHLDMLGRKGIYYRNGRELREILHQFNPCPDLDWDAYSAHYAPQAVMQRFQEIFLPS